MKPKSKAGDSGRGVALYALTLLLELPGAYVRIYGTFIVCWAAFADLQDQTTGPLPTPNRFFVLDETTSRPPSAATR